MYPDWPLGLALGNNHAVMIFIFLNFDDRNRSWHGSGRFNPDGGSVFQAKTRIRGNCRSVSNWNRFISHFTFHQRCHEVRQKLNTVKIKANVYEWKHRQYDNKYIKQLAC